MKGAGSGEGEGEGESEVIGVGVLFIISCFPYALISGLFSECNIIPHGCQDGVKPGKNVQAGLGTWPQ